MPPATRRMNIQVAWTLNGRLVWISDAVSVLHRLSSAARNIRHDHLNCNCLVLLCSKLNKPNSSIPGELGV